MGPTTVGQDVRIQPKQETGAEKPARPEEADFIFRMNGFEYILATASRCGNVPKKGGMGKENVRRVCTNLERFRFRLCTVDFFFSHLNTEENCSVIEKVGLLWKVLVSRQWLKTDWLRLKVILEIEKKRKKKKLFKCRFMNTTVGPVFDRMVKLSKKAASHISQFFFYNSMK